MRKLLLAAILIVPTLAWAQDDHDDHLTELDGLRAVHAWTRATSGGEALVFAELENLSTDEVLVEGAETAIAAGAELVGFELVDGEPAYTPLPPVPMAPGRELHLEPDGLAIRLTGLLRDLAEGDEFEMHLETSVGELELHVAVENENATQHSHAGHSH